MKAHKHKSAHDRKDPNVLAHELALKACLDALPQKSDDAISKIVDQEFSEDLGESSEIDTKKEHIRQYIGEISTYINKSINPTTRSGLVAEKTNEEKLYILDVAHFILRKNDAGRDELLLRDINLATSPLRSIALQSGIYMKYVFDAIRVNDTYMADFYKTNNIAERDMPFYKGCFERSADKFVDILVEHVAQDVTLDSDYCIKASKSASSDVMSNSAIYRKVQDMVLLSEAQKKIPSTTSSPDRSSVGSALSVDNKKLVRFGGDSLATDGKKEVEERPAHIRTPSPDPEAQSAKAAFSFAEMNAGLPNNSGGRK